MQIWVTQFWIHSRTSRFYDFLSYSLICFSYSDQPNAVVQIEQFLVVELIDGDFGEEVACDVEQTPTSAILTHTERQPPPVAAAVVAADSAEQASEQQQRVDAGVERAAERQFEPVQRGAGAAQRRRASLHRQRSRLRLDVVIRAGANVEPADKAESDERRAAGSASERSGRAQAGSHEIEMR